MSNVSVLVIGPLRKRIPGLSSYKLSDDFWTFFSRDSLVHQAHHANADAMMLHMLICFMNQAVQGDFLTIPQSQAPKLRPALEEKQFLKQPLISTYLKPQRLSQVNDTAQDNQDLADHAAS